MTCEKHENVAARGDIAESISHVSNFIVSMDFDLYLFPSDWEEDATFKAGDFRGRVDYERRIVAINEHCSICALLTLLHEAGHVVHCWYGFNSTTTSKEGREGTATMMGDFLRCKLGLSELLSLQRWMDFSFDLKRLTERSE